MVVLGFQAPRVIAAIVCLSFWRSNLLCKRSSKRSLLMILDCFVMYDFVVVLYVLFCTSGSHKKLFVIAIPTSRDIVV